MGMGYAVERLCYIKVDYNSRSGAIAGGSGIVRKIESASGLRFQFTKGIQPIPKQIVCQIILYWRLDFPPRGPADSGGFQGRKKSLFIKE